jgi:hypothetical protein
VDPHGFWPAFGALVAPAVPEGSHQLLLLDVHEIAGSPAWSAALTWRLMELNCASRSGWLAPSKVLRLACRL